MKKTHSPHKEYHDSLMQTSDYEHPAKRKGNIPYGQKRRKQSNAHLIDEEGNQEIEQALEHHAVLSVDDVKASTEMDVKAETDDAFADFLKDEA